MESACSERDFPIAIFAFHLHSLKPDVNGKQPYLSGLLARRQNAWSQDGGNMSLFWYVALCRVV